MLIGFLKVLFTVKGFCVAGEVTGGMGNGVAARGGRVHLLCKPENRVTKTMEAVWFASSP